MTDDSDSFIQEVDEGVRADRMMAAAKKWAPWAGALLVAVLGAAIGWEAWKSHGNETARKASEQFAAAQEQFRSNNLHDAATAFDTMAKTAPGNYRVMAMMEHAATLQAQGDLQASIAEYDRAAAAASDPLMRDTAKLRAAYLVADTQDFQAVRQRLEPLIAEKNQISYLARELLGVEAWEAGELQVARDALNGISLAFDAPQSVRQRVELELAVIGAGQPQPAPAHGAATTTTPTATTTGEHQ